MISQFKMAPKCPEVLPSVSKGKKAVMGFLDKICALDKLPSGLSYSTVGRRSDVNESMVYIISGVLKKKHT